MNHSRLKAFTILEIVVVLVLVGIITSIIFKSISMFNQQLSSNSKVKQELSGYYIFRAGIYEDLMKAERFYQAHQGVFLQGEDEVYLTKTSDGLLRKKNGSETLFNYKVNDLELKKNELDSIFYLSIEWKDRDLLITYPIRQNRATKVNNYFTDFDR